MLLGHKALLVLKVNKEIPEHKAPLELKDSKV